MKHYHSKTVKPVREWFYELPESVKIKAFQHSWDYKLKIPVTSALEALYVGVNQTIEPIYWKTVRDKLKNESR